MKLNRYHLVKVTGITLRITGGIWLILWVLKPTLAYLIPASQHPEGLAWYFALPDAYHLFMSGGGSEISSYWPFGLGLVTAVAGVALGAWANRKLKNFKSL